MSKVIFKLINELLAADKLGKQRVATNKLAKGIEQYANQRVIEELQNISDIADKEGIIALPVIKRIRELKQER